jgi:hypothetical protein
VWGLGARTGQTEAPGLEETEMQGRAINRRLRRAVLGRTGPQGEGGQGVGGGGQQGANQQGGQNTGTGQGGQGAGGGGDGGDPFAGLFDDIDLSGQGTGQQFGNQGGQQGGQGQQQAGQQGGNVQYVTPQQMQAEIDRRVNQVVQTLNRRYQNGQQQRQQNQNSGGQQGQQQNAGGQGDGFQAQAPTVDQGAVREARMAFREYLNDEFKPISTVEREFAVNIGVAVLGTRDLADADPDQVGREVARQTAQSMLAARKTVRDATIAQLKKQGAFTQEFLEKTKQGGGQSAAGAGSAGATAFLAPQAGAEGWAKGAAAAAKFNQQQGWTKPAAANTGS